MDRIMSALMFVDQVMNIARVMDIARDIGRIDIVLFVSKMRKYSRVAGEVYVPPVGGTWMGGRYIVCSAARQWKGIPSCYDKLKPIYVIKGWNSLVGNS